MTVSSITYEELWTAVSSKMLYEELWALKKDLKTPLKEEKKLTDRLYSSEITKAMKNALSIYERVYKEIDSSIRTYEVLVEENLVQNSLEFDFENCSISIENLYAETWKNNVLKILTMFSEETLGKFYSKTERDCKLDIWLKAREAARRTSKIFIKLLTNISELALDQKKTLSEESEINHEIEYKVKKLTWKMLKKKKELPSLEKYKLNFFINTLFNFCDDSDDTSMLEVKKPFQRSIKALKLNTENLSNEELKLLDANFNTIVLKIQENVRKEKGYAIFFEYLEEAYSKILRRIETLDQEGTKLWLTSDLKNLQQYYLSKNLLYVAKKGFYEAMECENRYIECDIKELSPDIDPLSLEFRCFERKKNLENLTIQQKDLVNSLLMTSLKKPEW